MLFFERDVELYVSTVEAAFTTSNTVKLAILGGSSINYKTNMQDTYNYKIEDAPNRLKEEVSTGYSTPEFNFSTYAKPYNDTTNDTTVEKLLLYSLTGNMGTESPTSYSSSFVSSNALPELFIWLKFGTLIYKMSNMVVKTAEYKFEINKILKINWKTIGLSLEKVISTPDTFTDYTTVNNFITSNFTKIDLTIMYPLSGYSAKQFLDNTDYVNKGTTGTVSENGDTSITTVSNQACYDMGVTGRLLFDGANFSGDLYPASDTGNMVFEWLLYWDGVQPAGEQKILNCQGDSSFYLYFQNTIGYALLPGSQHIGVGGGVIQTGFTLSDYLSTNAWHHMAFVADIKATMYFVYINGIPVAQCWNAPTFNDTTAATTGWSFGGTLGGSVSYTSGQLAYPELGWNDAVPKYNMHIAMDAGRAVDSNTVVKVVNTLTDSSSYAHTITSTNAGDAGGWLKSPLTTSTASIINVGRSAAWNSTDWTVEMQMYHLRTSGTYMSGQLFDDGVRRLDITNNVLEVRINGTLIMKDQNIAIGWYASSFPKSTWHHVVLEYHNGIYYLYLDGQLRGADARKTITPNTISSTGSADFLDITTGNINSLYLGAVNLNISDIARYAPDLIASNTANYVTDVPGKLPAISGTLKLKNNVQMVDSDTLNTRGTQHLGHYVSERVTELTFLGYMKTGSNSNIEIFELINNDLDYNETNKVQTTLTMGKVGEETITVTMPNSQIELPELKVQDVISSNIKIKAKRLDTDNDDTVITYTT